MTKFTCYLCKQDDDDGLTDADTARMEDDLLDPDEEWVALCETCFAVMQTGAGVQ